MPTALRAAGATVETHDDHFADTTLDVEWLAHAGQHGWIVLTKDEAIRRRPLELAALMSAGVAAFILTARGLTGAAMASLLVDALPRIERIVGTRARPLVATISATGDVVIKTGGARRGGIARG